MLPIVPNQMPNFIIYKTIFAEPYKVGCLNAGDSIYLQLSPSYILGIFYKNAKSAIKPPPQYPLAASPHYPAQFQPDA